MTSLITPKGPVIVPIQVDSQTVGGAKSSSVKSIYGKKVSLGGDSILQRLKDGALVYADPAQAQVAVTGRGSVTPIGVNAREAQFSDARPIEVQGASVALVYLYLTRTADSLTDIRADLTKAAASAGEAISYPSADRSRTLSPEGAGALQSPSKPTCRTSPNPVRRCMPLPAQ